MAIAMLFAVGLTSCEDFLDSENYTQANSSNYPASAGDLNKELAALYGVMNQFSTTPLETPWFVGYIMSDDANGAGGTGDVEAHAVGHLMANKEDLFDNAWHNTYVGIARANAIIYAVDAFDWTGQEDGTATNWSSIVPQAILDKVDNGWKGTDWFKEYENKNALQFSHAMTMTGGSDRSKFSISLNYSSNEGIMGADNASNYKRYGGRINSEHVLLKGRYHNPVRHAIPGSSGS